jgi:hypothetical protein
LNGGIDVWGSVLFLTSVAATAIALVLKNTDGLLITSTPKNPGKPSLIPLFCGYFAQILLWQLLVNLD